MIAAGIVPPGIEGSQESLADLLARLVGPGCGIELVSSVNGIPKGSRLAVSTNLLACLIAVCMRATGQAQSLTGPLAEHERRLVAARAILGEWLAGSGGGWQDSGGVWPGIKLIQGELAAEGDPEYGISRGRLLPSHHILELGEVPPATRQRLQDSLVLVHGGMAQNVGPILEMVTEKYLLRSEAEWQGRREACQVLDDVLAALREGDVQRIGAVTTRNFFGPIQTIIPWASNLYTETLIERARAEFGAGFWGFWMLGGMSGGGMGFIFDPAHKQAAQDRMLAIMQDTKRELENALPFAMEPVVYDFAINERGTWAELLAPPLLPPGYYAMIVPELLRLDRRKLPSLRRAELDRFGAACRTRPELAGMVQMLFDRLLPQARQAEAGKGRSAGSAGRVRLRPHAARADPRRPARRAHRPGAKSAAGDHRHPRRGGRRRLRRQPWLARQIWRRWASQALADGPGRSGQLAGGIGTRWTQGAGVVKALHPFCKLGGRHRTFIETHLAKSRRIARLCGRPVPHIITTSYLTHEPIADFLRRQRQLRLPRPAAALAGPRDRPAPDPHGTRPALRLGGDAAAAAGRTGAENARQPARGADRLGPPGRRRQRLHRQRADAMPAPGGPLVRDTEPAQERGARPPAGSSNPTCST